MHILEKIQYALNKIRNTKGAGPNGESTYELVKELDKYIKDNPVSSLDRLAVTYCAKDNFTSKEARAVQDFAKWVQLYQNGRETDNEYPTGIMIQSNL